MTFKSVGCVGVHIRPSKRRDVDGLGGNRTGVDDKPHAAPGQWKLLRIRKLKNSAPIDEGLTLIVLDLQLHDVLPVQLPGNPVTSEPGLFINPLDAPSAAPFELVYPTSTEPLAP